MVPRRNSHRLTFRPLAGRGLDLDLRSLSIVIVGTGVVLRFVQLIAQRPLWLDEVWMALNIVTRPFGGALQTLDAGQNAPVLFLWSERVAVLVGAAPNWRYASYRSSLVRPPYT